jgi:hypothetical protein
VKVHDGTKRSSFLRNNVGPPVETSPESTSRWKAYVILVIKQKFLPRQKSASHFSGAIFELSEIQVHFLQFSHASLSMAIRHMIAAEPLFEPSQRGCLPNGLPR